MEKASEYRVVFVTTITYDNAENMAKILVSEKYAGCCTVVPNVLSVFTWEGAIDMRQEFLIIIKTKADKLNLLETRVKELHPDEVPEIISVTLDSGSSAYLKWLDECVKED